MNLQEQILETAEYGMVEFQVYYMMFMADGYTEQQIDEAFMALVDNDKLGIDQNEHGIFPFVK